MPKKKKKSNEKFAIEVPALTASAIFPAMPSIKALGDGTVSPSR